jgi:uncharacterized membrane protein YfcA
MAEHQIVALCFIALVSSGLSYVGAAVGLVLGQLRVALLTYVLGGAVEGAATSLAVSTVATLVGAVAHRRQGHVNLRLLVSVGGPSAIGAYAAAHYSGLIDPRILKLLIALTLLLTGIHMLWRSRLAPEEDKPRAPPLAPGVVIAFQVATGAVLGTISGLVGLLLGSLRLPAMLRFMRVPAATAVGTNMAIGAITGLSAGVSAVVGGHVNVAAFALVAPLTLVGAQLGAQKTGKLDRLTLTRWIAYALIPTAIVMLLEIGLDFAHG